MINKVNQLLNKTYRGAAGMAGYMFIIMIVSLGVVMLFYTLYYDIVVTIFYGVAIDNGMPMQKADMFIAFYQYFPIPMFISLITHFLINSQREERY
jgi:hypothetical protein